jgi:hypothetical protein
VFGAFAWFVNFELTSATKCGGYFFQHVTISYNIKDLEVASESWWELWFVEKGSKRPTDPAEGGLSPAVLQALKALNFPDLSKKVSDDQWAEGPKPNQGSVTWKAKVYFVDDVKKGVVPDGFAKGNAPKAGNDLISKVAGADDADTLKFMMAHPKYGPVPHEIELQWEKDGTTKVGSKTP